MTSLSMQTTAASIEQRIRDNRLLSLPVEWDDEIVYPNYDGLSIMNTAQSVLDIFGVEVESPLDDAVWGGDSPVGQVDRVVVFLTDGLGYKLLNELMDEDTDLRDSVAELSDGRGPVPLTSTLPSTTAVALPTMWTATYPGRHGMIGTSMYLRQFSTLANMLNYSPQYGHQPAGVLSDWGLAAEEFVSVPSIADQLREAGVKTHLLLNYGLMGTGLSRILHRGVTERHRHIGLNDSWGRLRDLLERTAGQRAYFSAYLPNIDSLSHAYGFRSHYVQAEIKHQMTMLRDILDDERVQDGRTLFILLADHGHYDTAYSLDVDRDDDAGMLREAMRSAFGGDASLSHLYLRGGYQQRVIDWITHNFTDKFAWIEPQVALHNNLYGPGPLHPDLVNRMGDLILLSRAGVRLADRARPFSAKSWHSGLSDWEMLVPFIWRRI
jgi:hypothetical protein